MKKSKLYPSLLCFLLLALLIPSRGAQAKAGRNAVKEIKINQSTFTLKKNKSKKLKVSIKPKRLQKKKLIWKSSSKEIVSVNKKGKLKARKNGKAVITVRVKGSKKKASCTVYVGTPVKGVRLQESDIYMKVGQKSYINASVYPKKATLKGLSYRSSKKSIAVISKDGLITAKKVGTCYITMIPEDRSGNIGICKLHVKKNTDTKDNQDSEEETKDQDNRQTNEDESPQVLDDEQNSEVENPTTPEPDQTTEEEKAELPKEDTRSEAEIVEEHDAFAKSAASVIKDYGTPDKETFEKEGEFASRRLIVKMENSTDILDTHIYNVAAVVNSSDGIYVLQFNSIEDTEDAYNNLSKLSAVKWVETDSYVETNKTCISAKSDDSNDSSPLSWGVKMTGADKYAKYLSMSAYNTPITVSVVDTGVANHPFLKGRILNTGYDFVNDDPDPDDENEHGTHVSGTIVDCTPGLNVKILPVRALDSEGNGSTVNVANGIRYAVDHGASIINLSLGGDHDKYLEESISYALEKGVTVIAAAGNDTQNTSQSCPAHMKDIIVVSAIDENQNKASFSNYGDSVDVCAPGVGIYSCVLNGKYDYFKGTSMATPHVSAIAAMVKLEHPQFTPAQVEQFIKDNTIDLGEDSWDIYYGYGLPDVSKIAVIEPTDISIDQDNISIYEGESYNLTATVLPQEASDKSVTWTSQDPDIASVKNGLVVGKAQGTTTITARTSNGKETTCVVEVNRTIPVIEFWLEEEEISLEKGKTCTMKTHIMPDDATDQTINWSSDNTDVATVDDGIITGHKKGTAIITARTSSGVEDTCSVHVLDPDEEKIKELVGFTDYVLLNFISDLLNDSVPDEEFNELLETKLNMDERDKAAIAVSAAKNSKFAYSGFGFEIYTKSIDDVKDAYYNIWGTESDIDLPLIDETDYDNYYMIYARSQDEVFIYSWDDHRDVVTSISIDGNKVTETLEYKNHWILETVKTVTIEFSLKENPKSEYGYSIEKLTLVK